MLLYYTHCTILPLTGPVVQKFEGASTKGRGEFNGKAGQAAALPKSSDTLTLSQPRGADYAQPLALPCLKKSVIKPLKGDDKHRFP